jgi:hypothetical protein
MRILGGKIGKKLIRPQGAVFPRFDIWGLDLNGLLHEPK